MKTFINNSKRGIALLAFGMTISSVVLADEVNVAGSTLGQFNAQSYAATNSIMDLVYNNSTFDNTTVGGMLDLGGAPDPGSNFNNLGSFSLGSMNNVYNGNTFTLQVTFSAPTTIVGGSSAVFTDIIFGTVLNGNGGVFIDFDNTPQIFAFSNANEAGVFSMFVNDVSIAPGQNASLTGHIEGVQEAVPEPASMFLLAGAALGFMRARKRK